MITDISNAELFTEELISKLKTKKLHLICPAIKEQSFCVDYLAVHLNISIQDIENYCRAVNERKEPGCLFPRYTVTLFPVESKSINLSYCIKEVFKAQEIYFNAEEMLFAFDKKSWSDLTLVKKELEKYLDTTPIVGKLKKVSFLIH